jgi:serine/threonine protein kinase
MTVFGKWHRLEKLGSGGNAKVWKVIDKDGREGAIKILNAKDPNSEPYKRFRTEIELLRKIGTTSGVLPLLDEHLPAKPTENDPAWLVTPVAIKLRDAIGMYQTLTTVVDAINSISKTLSKLVLEFQVSHRDIKPDNLYSLDNQWMIGDFGLVDFPGKEALTADGAKLGPMYYIAPEMLADAATADGFAADVYSLAKTLWVLATGQHYPLAGELRIDTETCRLSTYVVHPYAICSIAY